MQTTQIGQLAIIGIAIRTTNENGQSAVDIPQLWDRFFLENILAAIPNKISDKLYCIYTDYEKDHTKPYTTILGCSVANLDAVPAGLTGKLIDGGSYGQFIATGKIPEGIVLNEWIKIWNSNVDRAYTADFEVYDERAQDPNDAVVDIFIALK